MKKYILLLLMLLVINSKGLYAQHFLVEEDLRLNWIFYDEEEDLMLPFLDNSSARPYAIHLPVNDIYSQKSIIRLEIPANTSLFIKNMFIEKHKESGARLLSVDSLLNSYDREGVNLTLYNKNGFSKPPDSKVGFIQKTFNSSITVNPISKRNLDSRIDYMKIIILLIFTFFVVLYNLFPSDLFEFLSLTSLINFRFTSTAFIKYRSLTKTQSLVIVYEAALISGILIIFLSYFDNPFDGILSGNINPIVGWLAVLIIILVLIVLKYLLISMISTLFHVSDKTNFYFIEFLRMAMIFYSLVFVVLSFFVINRFYLIQDVLKNIVTIAVIFNIIRFVILYFKFRRTVPMKSLHLFSYLCTTELIPIILGMKFFLK